MMRFGIPKQHLGFMALMSAVVLPLPGCTFDPPVSPGQITHAASVASDAYKKAMYVAEAGFAGVTAALDTAVSSGNLKGANAQKALVIYDKLKASLDKARTTKQQADAILAQSYIADLWATILAVRS